MRKQESVAGRLAPSRAPTEKKDDSSSARDQPIAACDSADASTYGNIGAIFADDSPTFGAPDIARTGDPTVRAPPDRRCQDASISCDLWKRSGRSGFSATLASTGSNERTTAEGTPTSDPWRPAHCQDRPRTACPRPSEKRLIRIPLLKCTSESVKRSPDTEASESKALPAPVIFGSIRMTAYRLPRRRAAGSRTFSPRPHPAPFACRYLPERASVNCKNDGAPAHRASSSRAHSPIHPSWESTRAIRREERREQRGH